MKKILRNTLITLLAIVGIVLLIAAFVDGDISTERQVTIARPRTEVFEYLRMTRNHQNFSVWLDGDPNTKLTFTGTDGAVGALYAWDSEIDEVGKGEQEIMQLKEGERIDYELRFERPFKATHKAFFATADTQGGTLVSWGFEGEMGYPMRLLLLFMDMKGELGGKLQHGLDNLKSLLESQPPLTTPSDSAATDSSAVHP